MKKFILKILLFIVLLFTIFLINIYISSIKVQNRNFNNSQTESNLLVLRPNSHYDIIFIGNSHARNFSRHNNHQRVKKILNRRILNLGQSGAYCGNNEYLFYLNYIYSKNITADTIIHNLFSQMLFMPTSNIVSNTFVGEPFKFDFFLKYLFYPYAQNKWLKMFYYIKSKSSKKWAKTKPYSLKSKTDSLLKIDSVAINKGLKYAYERGFDTNIFNRSCKITEKLIQTAQKNGSAIIFITTPTLFGDWPHHDDIVGFMSEMHDKYGIKYFNFANCIDNPNLFYDHHHLNTKGIVYFTKNFLKPALQEKDSTYLVY